MSAFSTSSLTKSSTAGVAALVAVVVGLAGCSSSGNKKPAGTSTSPTTSAAAPSSTPASSAASSPAAVTASGSPADAATVAAVTTAYATFFKATNTLAQTEAVLQNGTKLAAALAAQAKNPTAKTLSATVTSVALVNPNVANVIFTLNSNGQPLLKNTPGLAVKQDGVWKLAAQTFCGLAAAAGPAPAACSDTTITALPS